ncbi:uncharacterized protein SOCE26_097640 [Sorangium cellulosum]|uniref:Uncharacterized protein n=1 Tax=Sorangium cellulosum TaxID=56 RepID=A0A2L0F9M0_SORCE|nr:hypothetical protein [Sorangium cellulosum]AUX48233.1 uncharacterized protein SOCE26_097640 [Sorangium cellulosum]
MSAPDRLAFDRAAGELLCELLNAPAGQAKFLLPTLPGVSHPDGYLRLSRISRAIDRIANDDEGLAAAIDRDVAAYTTGLVDPFCRKTRDAQASLPASLGARVSCEALLVPPPAEDVCNPFSAELQEVPLPNATLAVAAQSSRTGGAALIEVDAPVSAAASLGSRGILLGTGDFFGEGSAIGLLPGGAARGTLARLPCTPTSIAAGAGRGVVFCHDPLGVVPLSQDGKPERVLRLRRVMLGGAQVDGFIPGLLDRKGQPEDQSMYQSPLVHGQVDRYSVPLMRQARFSWAGVVDGHVLAALDFPGGGSATVEPHAAMGVTLTYDSGRVAPLPLWRALPSCTAVTDSMEIASAGSRWFGVLPLSPIEVVELDAGGSQVTQRLMPRRLPSGELAELDVPRCAFSPAHGELTCVDEEGGIFVPSGGKRIPLGAFPKEPAQTTVAMCGASKGLNLLVKKRIDTGDEYALYTIGKGQPRGSLVHRELYDRGGLSCNTAGSVAFFSTTSRGVLVHLPD